MSLNIYLRDPEPESVMCYSCGYEHNEHKVLYDANITHNLGKMAQAVGIYKCLWYPEEMNITTAKELIEPLEEGIDLLRKRPLYYKNYDAPNGWGTFDVFLPWLMEYLHACRQYPNALVTVNR
jgi:hypothetical protein